MLPVVTLNQFAAKHGLVTTADVDSHIHAGLRCKPGTKTYDRWNKRRLAELQAARDETVRLYREAIERGEFRDLTDDERLLLAAEHGHPDNPSVQAARRVLEKRRTRQASSTAA